MNKVHNPEIYLLECAIGVFKYVANSRAVVTLYDSDWLLLILMMFHCKSMVS